MESVIAGSIKNNRFFEPSERNKKALLFGVKNGIKNKKPPFGVGFLSHPWRGPDGIRHQRCEWKS